MSYFLRLWPPSVNRTNWEECSTCEDDRDPEWLCPAAVAVYRDLLMDGSAKTSADIVERNGGAGERVPEKVLYGFVL